MKKGTIKQITSGFLAVILFLSAVIAGNQSLTFGAQKEPVFTWRETTAERNLYYDDYTIGNIGKCYSGETIEEIFQMLEDPSVDLEMDTFFDGTIFEGCTEEELEYFQSEGWTLEQLIRDVSDARMASVWNYLYGVMALSDSRNAFFLTKKDVAVEHTVAFGEIFCYNIFMGKPESRAAYPPLPEVAGCQWHPFGNDRSGVENEPSRQKKGGMPMYVTYADCIQTGIFIVALVGLCFTIFKGRK